MTSDASLEGDPLDWKVDQVVEVLCHQYHRWSTVEGRPYLPESDILEQRLRENGITGISLLTYLDDASIKDVLGITHFGHRATLTWAIKRLRLQSVAFQETKQEEDRASAAAVAVPNMRGLEFSTPGQAPVFPHQGHAMSPTLFNAYRSAMQSPASSIPFHNQIVWGTPNPTPRLSVADSVTAASGGLPLSLVEGSSATIADAVDATIVRRAASAGIEEPSAKRVKTAHSTEPTTSELANLHPEVNHTVEPNLLPPPDNTVVPSTNLQPGQIYRDEHGRKRLAPVFVRDSDQPPTAAPDVAAEPALAHSSSDDIVDAESNGSEFPIAPEDSPVRDGSSLAEPSVDETLTYTGGHVTVDEHGRKRLKLTLSSSDTTVAQPAPMIDKVLGRDTSPPQPALVIDKVPSQDMSPPKASDQPPQKLHKHHRSTSGTGNKPNLRSSLGYLGKDSFPIDAVFYGDTAIGSELQNNSDYPIPLSDPPVEGENFLVLPGNSLPTGRRLYVHSVIKHHLMNGEGESIRRGNQRFLAIRPYPSRKSSKPTFTLISSTSSVQVTATREDLAQWPEVNALEDTPFVEKLISNPQAADLPEESDALLDRLAEKWSHVDEGQEPLPIYLESGSEGDYEDDLWAELDREDGVVEPTLGRPKKKPFSPDQVEEALEKTMRDLVEEWQEKQRPKLQQKAWRLWTQSKRNRSRKRDIQQAEAQLKDIISKRLPKYLDEIKKGTFTSVMQLRKMHKALEPTVFNREELKWTIAVLKSKTMPERPLPDPANQKVKAKKDNDDNSELLTPNDSDESSKNAEDDDDDFLDDDSIDGEAERIARKELNDLKGTSDVVADEDLIDEDSEGEIMSPKDKRRKKGTPHSSSEGNTHRHSPTRNSSSAPGPSYLAPARPDITPPPKGASKAARSTENVIDLTMSSDEYFTPSGIRTPTLNKSASEKSFETKSRSKSSRNVHGRGSRINQPFVSDSSSDSSPHQEGKNKPQVSLSDAASSTTRFPDFSAFEKNKDHEGLLKAILDASNSDYISNLEARFGLLSKLDIQEEIWEGIEFLSKKHYNNPRADTATAEELRRLARLYCCWYACKKFKLKSGIPGTVLNEALNDKNRYDAFHATICQLLKVGGPKAPFSVPDESTEDGSRGKANGAGGSSKRKSSMQKADLTGKIKTVEGRKKTMWENVQAANIRQSDQQRLREQAARKRRLEKKLEQIGTGLTEDAAHIIINPEKFEDQELIYINPRIGQMIKKHQIEGVRFMWRELVMDSRSLQGCLLAHTMGLGKTMQVITLLVTIAEAAKSQDPSVAEQIPESLRQSRTLVLCPPSLIDNWWDEVLMWAPDPLSSNIGHLRKIDSTSQLPDRVGEIEAWYSDGGVLLISYEMFRDLINNKRLRIDVEPHENIRKMLLQGPNIIVADEAHKLKNTDSAIATATAQFRSKSRIALTGSPLANHLNEYFAMIDWVAPGYLGPIAEFKAKYTEPIEEGLYSDSSKILQRRSLKMLEVLKRDVAPKVNRADITVLKGQLPSKTEFLITVPLTPVQECAYRKFVESMLEKAQDDKVANTRLWDWLAVLSLLCNHPICFRDKLKQREEQRQSRIVKKNNSEDDDVPGDAPLSKLGVGKDLIQAQLSFLDSIDAELHEISLSYKVRLFDKILDAAIIAGDKTLVFSHSIPTLNYLESFFRNKGQRYVRLDGKTNMASRQAATKDFNTGAFDVYLVSTRAGGLGLNLPGANRVVIFDFNFNPFWEEQAVGRSYRFGQKKPVFVYRFLAGGTFEDVIHNKAVFKLQLATRVVDKRNPERRALKGSIKQYLFEPTAVEQKDLAEFAGKDPQVLDNILGKEDCIRSIELTETFQKDEDEKLTAEEEKEADQLYKDEQMKRSNPKAWMAERSKRAAKTYASRPQLSVVHHGIVPGHMPPLPHSVVQGVVAGQPLGGPGNVVGHGPNGYLAGSPAGQPIGGPGNGPMVGPNSHPPGLAPSQPPPLYNFSPPFVPQMSQLPQFPTLPPHPAPPRVQTPGPLLNAPTVPSNGHNIPPIPGTGTRVEVPSNGHNPSPIPGAGTRLDAPSNGQNLPLTPGAGTRVEVPSNGKGLSPIFGAGTRVDEGSPRDSDFESTSAREKSPDPDRMSIDDDNDNDQPTILPQSTPRNDTVEKAVSSSAPVESKTAQQTARAETPQRTPKSKTPKQTLKSKTPQQTPKSKTPQQTPKSKTPRERHSVSDNIFKSKLVALTSVLVDVSKDLASIESYTLPETMTKEDSFADLAQEITEAVASSQQRDHAFKMSMELKMALLRDSLSVSATVLDARIAPQTFAHDSNTTLRASAAQLLGANPSATSSLDRLILSLSNAREHAYTEVCTILKQAAAKHYTKSISLLQLRQSKAVKIATNVERAIMDSILADGLPGSRYEGRRERVLGFLRSAMPEYVSGLLEEGKLAPRDAVRTALVGES